MSRPHVSDIRPETTSHFTPIYFAKTSKKNMGVIKVNKMRIYYDNKTVTPIIPTSDKRVITKNISFGWERPEATNESPQQKQPVEKKPEQTLESPVRPVRKFNKRILWAPKKPQTLRIPRFVEGPMPEERSLLSDVRTDLSPERIAMLLRAPKVPNRSAPRRFH